jgi:hypothetical protein
MGGIVCIVVEKLSKIFLHHNKNVSIDDLIAWELISLRAKI